MKIPYSSSIVGLRLYFDRIGCTVQKHDREPEQVQAHFEWPWIRKRWCGNGYPNRKDYQRGKLSLENIHARYLTRSS